MKVIQVCFFCSMLCTDGLLLHLVGKRHVLVYLGASLGIGELGDSIWERRHKSSEQGARRANTPPWLTLSDLVQCSSPLSLYGKSLSIGDHCCTIKSYIPLPPNEKQSSSSSCGPRSVHPPGRTSQHTTMTPPSPVMY